MNEGFSELIQCLDGKFEKIDTRFIEIGQKLNKLEGERADKKDINNLLITLDSYAKKLTPIFKK